MSPCQVWRGARNNDGYATMRVRRYVVLAHRMAYRLHKGPIPRGHELHHTCKRRDCVNPEHLETVTHRAHMRGHRKPRRQSHAKDH